MCCNFLGTLQGDFFNETWSGAGSMITDSSLASGAQTTEVHEAQGEFWKGEFWKGTALPKKDFLRIHFRVNMLKSKNTNGSHVSMISFPDICYIYIYASQTCFFVNIV